MIPNQFVQDLLARTDIVEVVGTHVTLRKTGANFSGLCPFHNEKSPSFSVSPAKQFYHCFGCGVSGSALGFLMEYSGYAFPEAVEELARKVGLTVPSETRHSRSALTPDQAIQQADYRTQLLEHNLLAAKFYKQQLKKHAGDSDNKAVEYLKRRGVSGEVAAKYGIGYAPDDWQALAKAATNYGDNLWVDVGLVIEKKPEQLDDAPTRRYDRFRDRIMFPIRSTRGEIIGFGGRVLDQSEPKYLNSPETPLFNKSHELYGLNEARMAIRAVGYALVTEGYMDVIALAQWGFAQSVATLGTAVGGLHVQKLFRYTDHIVFSFDGDKAGRKAAWRALEASLPILTDTRRASFLFLPAEHDPDSFVRQEGTQAFEQAIVQAVPLSHVWLKTLSERHDVRHAEGRASLLHEAKPMLQTIQARMLRLQLTKGLAALTQITSAEVERFLELGRLSHDLSNAAQSQRIANTNRSENLADRYQNSTGKRSTGFISQTIPQHKAELDGRISSHKTRLSKADWAAQQRDGKTGIQKSYGALTPQKSKAYLLGLVLLQQPSQFVVAKPWLMSWRLDLNAATRDEKNLVLLCDALEFLHNTQAAFTESAVTQYLSLQTEQGRSETLMPWLQAAYTRLQDNVVLPAADDAVRLAAHLRHEQLQVLCQQAALVAGQSSEAMQHYKRLNTAFLEAKAVVTAKLRSI
jgi:DNA primase